MNTHRLVLLRHGQSQWNLEDRFTGWADVDLSDEGEREARGAARLLREQGFAFDIAYTSVLRRAIRTLWIVLDGLDRMWIPVVHTWRRSYSVQPPSLTVDDERWSGRDPRYRMLQPEQVPLTESLRDTVDRVVPFWNDSIAPALSRGRSVLIAAHGNSLRALVKFLDRVSDEDIVGLNIPTGAPLVYELDDALRPNRHFYLVS